MEQKLFLLDLQDVLSHVFIVIPKNPCHLILVHEYTIDEANELIDSNLQNQTYKVNFTGGDPLIQHQAVAQLAKHIQNKKIPTYLESSCFDIDRFNHVLPFIDIIKIEFKTKDSDFVDSKHYEKLIGHTMKCLESSVTSKKTTYIKIVVSSKTQPDEFKKLVDEIFNIISKGKY